MCAPLRTLVLAILTALILSAPSFAPPEPGAENHLRLAANHRGGVDVVPVNRLMRAVKRANLRSGSGTHYDKVGLLQVGQQVRVTGEVGDWLRVKTPSGNTAFVYAPLLADTAQSAAATQRQRRAPAPRVVRSIDEAHKAVWMMHNLKPGEIFDKNNSEHIRGSAFAWGPRDFMTNVHVLHRTFKREKTLGSITLSQEGNDVELKIERVVAINIAYDLAHIRTTRSVPHYLDPVYEKGLPLEAYEDLDSLGDELTPMGYLGGSFVNVEPRQEISYKDIRSYAFATEYYNLKGLSGGPVINSDGHFVGVSFFAEINMIYFIKITHVAKFLSQESGVRCRNNDIESCLLRGARHVAQMARQGNTLSLYHIGSKHGLAHKIDPNLDRNFHALVDAAKKQFPRAEYELAFLLYSHGAYKESFYLLKRSAKKGHPPSVYELGRIYFGEEGMGKLRSEIEKIDQEKGEKLLRLSYIQGYFPARDLLKKKGLLR